MWMATNAHTSNGRVDAHSSNSTASRGVVVLKSWWSTDGPEGQDGCHQQDDRRRARTDARVSGQNRSSAGATHPVRSASPISSPRTRRSKAMAVVSQPVLGLSTVARRMTRRMAP